MKKQIRYINWIVVVAVGFLFCAGYGGFILAKRNWHVCIISVGPNPEIKERIYRKECYVVDDSFLDVPRVNVPYYFVMESDGCVKWLFSPNYLFEEFTDIYLKQLRSAYDIFECRTE